MKVGTDAATDVQRVASVRDAVGPDVAIRLDANQGWTPRGGRHGHPGARGRRPRRRVRRAAGRRRRRRGARLGAGRVGLPVMADESCYGPRPRADHPAAGGRPRQRQARQVRVARVGARACCDARRRPGSHDRRLDDGEPHRGRRGGRARRRAADDHITTSTLRGGRSVTRRGRNRLQRQRDPSAFRRGLGHQGLATAG